eukprot:scaffold12706_cov90-Isochrysis_galbana.AAC.1
MADMDVAATTPRIASMACTPNQPRRASRVGKVRKKKMEEVKPSADSRDDSTAAPSLPKSRAKKAVGSEVGMAMVAPAAAARAVFVAVERRRRGAGLPVGTGLCWGAAAGRCVTLRCTLAARRPSVKGAALKTDVAEVAVGLAWGWTTRGALGSARASAAQQAMLSAYSVEIISALSSCVAASYTQEPTSRAAT